MKKALTYCFMFLLSPLFLWGQVANNTSLVGTVVDASGSVVPGAHVTGVNEATKVAYAGDTIGEGYYSIPFVAPGTYDVTVEHSGFNKTTSTGVIVQINMAVRTDLTLSVGSNATEITVTADTAALSTDDALLGDTITTGKVESLPMNGRHAMDLAATAPNITVNGSAFTGNPPGESAIGAGTRAVYNSLTLDGITIMNNLGSTSSVSPNPDALESVQTQNGNYTAQYGDYMGVHVNMVTKTGTNQIHGTVYDYIQNDALQAKSWLAPPGSQKSKLRSNEFGGVISGPVVIPFLYNGRDKTFFMGSYEGLRMNSTTLSTGTVISSAMRNGNFSALLNPALTGGNPIQLFHPGTKQPYIGNIITDPISPQARNVLQYLTPDNIPNTLANNFSGNVPNTVSMDQTVDRIDHNIGEKIRLFGRFDWQRLNTLTGAINPSSNNYSPTNSRNGVFGYTHIITPNLVNDARFGFNILTTKLLNYFAENGITDAGSKLGIPGFTSDVTANNPGLPTITISGYQGTEGEDGTNWYQDDRTLQGYDQISYTFKQHSFMAGIDIRKLTIGRAAQDGPRGTFAFSNQYTGDAAADFYLGVAQSAITPYFQVKGSVGQWRDGFFFQDTWLVTPKFTLQYGLRYELPTVAYSLNGFARILNPEQTALIPASNATSAAGFTPTPGFKFTNPNHNDWAPRFGFAYRPTDKIVVRGGGGIYYNANHLNAFTLASANYPMSASVTYNGAPSTPTVTFANPTPGAGTASPVAGTPGSYVNVFTDNPNLPTARMYQWNLDTGLELWRNAGFELQYLGSRSLHLDESYYPNQPNPGPNPTPDSTINSRRPNQLFGTIREIQNDSFATYNGLTALLHQRLTHGFSTDLGYTWSHSLDTSSDSNSGGSAMWQGHLKLDYGNSNWDIRNRFVGTFTYALPTFSATNFATREALGGWQLNGIVDLETGQPFNVSFSQDIANTGIVNAPQRPNYVHVGRSTCSRSSAIEQTSCIDATAYALPAQYTYGNLHRNDLHGPGKIDTNLSVFKNFAIYENLTFQFRAEAFNVFNHADPSNPNSTLGATNFGTISSAQNTPRLVQLAGKINF
ncbi:MAG TPA: TonB-dependent receptor [Granulicella sp.]